MRAFNEGQVSVFLNAFGETIELQNGDAFTAIVEVVPVVIDTGGQSFIEGEETYLSMDKQKQLELNIKPDTVLLVRGTSYTVYNIVDDLSGVVNVYYRTTEGQHFAEDY